MNKFLWLLFGISCGALAQAVVGAVVPAPAAPGILDKILAIIPATDSKEAGILAFVLGGVIDLSIRLKKSQKPLDLMIIIGRVFHGVGGICMKMSNLIDKILPSNSVEPKVK